MNDTLYEAITKNLVEHGYIVIKNALLTALRTSLFQKAQEEDSYKLAAISQTTQAHIDTKKRSDKTKWLDEDNATQSEYLKIMNGLQEYLNRSLYLGLNYYEAHFALYNEGNFYEKHMDSFRNSKNRVVTTVYYLNEEWSEEDGGELIIYDNATDKKIKVSPQGNTLVVFMSEKFPHEVLPAKKQRYSIAGWFRVDKPIF